MLRLLAAAMLGAALVGCGQVGEPAPATPPTTQRAPAPVGDGAAVGVTTTIPHPDGADLMALGLREIVAANTGATREAPLGTVLVLEELDLAGVVIPGQGPRPLSDAERAAITDALGEVAGRVEFVADPFGFIDDPVPDTVLVTANHVRFDAEGALIPVNLVCGAACDVGLTYRAQLVDGEWTLAGSEGPVMVGGGPEG